MSQKCVLPVIHHYKNALSLVQASIAFENDADGVFLIGGITDRELVSPALAIKEKFPDKLIGLNLFRTSPLVAFDVVISNQLDMLWADSCGVSSHGLTPEAIQIRDILKDPLAPLFFGSIAFKYQPPEHNPTRAAYLAKSIGMIPTTSGVATGEPPSLTKIQTIYSAVGNELAIASGLDPTNVTSFLKYVNYFIVATGISIDDDDFRFDPIKLHTFSKIVHGDEND